MSNQTHEIRQALTAGNYQELFIELLGWDKSQVQQEINCAGQKYFLRGLARKWNFQVFGIDCGNAIPDSKMLSALAREVSRLTPENIVLFHTSDHKTQTWQWARREPGKPVALRHERVLNGQPNALLIEKVEALTVSLDEEEKARHEGRDTVLAISQTVRAAFDVEKVTKKFYERFSKEHAAFLAFIKGIPDDELQGWYASVMLNRLMFIYFIQHKGFLYFDGKEDKQYLLNQLNRAKKEKRPFYQGFLRPLFERAFATPQKDRSAADDQLFGKVPYLNGGLFTTHQIERDHDDIQISDGAFDKIFDFFDDYDWHLDDRPLSEGREINPDVLGYIFEKYINQKQMGAYYTKEDITGYIARNTILPFWLERAKEQLPQAFEGENSVWKLLQENPDKYIYPAVRHGLCDEAGILRELPENIARGIDDVSQRGDWNKPAPSDWGLPTEIWREVVARQQKYFSTYDRCRGTACCAQNPASPSHTKEIVHNNEGTARCAPTGISSIDDLITLNLDIVQFCEDVVSLWADESLVRELWKALAGNQNRNRKSNEDASNGISVLDPTCGSGAFLFAAINILEPLYSACLDRMTGFVVEADSHNLKQKNADFREILKRVDDTAHHPNRQYFVLKNILVNNLFGVDIMEEAVEICKLRLFLKLASCVEPNAAKDNFGIEPLPDIDFNIRAGNTLVGFASEDELKRAFSDQLSFDDTLEEIKHQAQDIKRAFDLFRQCQTENRDAELPAAKKVLSERLAALRGQLDAKMAEQYEINLSKNPKKLAAWHHSHQPFHWFIEFYGILNRGGFDCIIGNPPYVEYSKIKKEYSIKEFETESCGNLYSFCIENCFRIMHKLGRMGMIVQLPIVCTDRMKPLQNLCMADGKSLWFSTFDDRPARLFDGLEHIRACVFLSTGSKQGQQSVQSTNYNRWYSDFRQALFESLSYTDVKDYLADGAIPKIGTTSGEMLQQEIREFTPLGHHLVRHSINVAYFHNAPQYWIRAMNFPPYFWNERGGEQVSTQMKSIYLPTQLDAGAIVATLNSSLFYWWFIILSDCRHLNLREIETFPLGLDAMTDITKKELMKLSEKLMLDLQRNANRKDCIYKTTGRVVYDEYFPSQSKPIIDEIDRVLASHYGFTDEELDFIINYDIKYRMGKAANHD